MANDLRAYPDELLLQARQRPVVDRPGRRQCSYEIAEVVGERVKVKADDVGGERPARKPRPFDRALALLVPLLRRPAQSRMGHVFRRNRTAFPRIPTGLKPRDVRGHEYFRPVNRIKMFHVKHFDTIRADLDRCAGRRQAEQA